MSIKNYLIDTVAEVQSFVKTANAVPFAVTVKQGNYVVDGKSILGLYSLNLTRPVFVEFPEEGDMELFDKELRMAKSR